MEVHINGESRNFQEDSLSVSQLLDQLNLGYPVLVELNGIALFPREFPEKQVQSGDRIELLRMVAGG